MYVNTCIYLDFVHFIRNLSVSLHHDGAKELEKRDIGLHIDFSDFWALPSHKDESLGPFANDYISPTPLLNTWTGPFPMSEVKIAFIIARKEIM